MKRSALAKLREEIISVRDKLVSDYQVMLANEDDVFYGDLHIAEKNAVTANDAVDHIEQLESCLLWLDLLEDES